MNINDVSEFLTLVQNPEKYEKYVQELKEEKQRLDASVATVIEVSSLEQYKKELAAREQHVTTLETVYNEKVAQENEKLLAKEEELNQATQDLMGVERTVSIAKAEVEQQQKDLDARESALELAKQEFAKFVTATQEKQKTLDAKIAEYNERTEKLKAVMG